MQRMWWMYDHSLFRKAFAMRQTLTQFFVINVLIYVNQEKSRFSTSTWPPAVSLEKFLFWVTIVSRYCLIGFSCCAWGRNLAWCTVLYPGVVERAHSKVGDGELVSERIITEYGSANSIENEMYRISGYFKADDKEGCTMRFTKGR